jgi:hypothetical protein
VKRRQRAASANGVRADAVLRSSLTPADNCNIPQNVFKSISMPVVTRAVTQSASIFSRALQDLESDPLVNRGRDHRRDGQHRQRMHADTGESPLDTKSAARSRVPISLLLALTAPREERGREIRSIAVSFPRRAGLFLRGIWVWFHHLPIKIPGGMTEYR